MDLFEADILGSSGDLTCFDGRIRSFVLCLDIPDEHIDPGSKKAEELDADSDFDPSDDELPLSKRANLLRCRDSRMICQAARRQSFPQLPL